MDKLILAALITLCLSLSIEVNCQTAVNPMKYEFSIVSGYNNSIGVIGMSGGIRLESLGDILQIKAGVGFMALQPRISTGINFFLFKSKKLCPYFGNDFSVGFSSNISTKMNTEVYHIGPNLYLAPYGGLRLSSKNEFINFKIQLGELFLLHSPKVESISGSQTSLANFEERLKGGFMISFGMSMTVNEFID